MSKDFGTFDWRWNGDLRDRTLTIPETERHAPYSWQAWTVAGHQGLGWVKRRLTKTADKQHWRSTTRSRLCRRTCATGDLRLLQRSKRQVQIAGGQGGRAHPVGLWRRLSVGLGNPPSSDGGADFVGRLDIGIGFSRVKQVVFG